jgi:hypothetical protein
MATGIILISGWLDPGWTAHRDPVGGLASWRGSSNGVAARFSKVHASHEIHENCVHPRSSAGCLAGVGRRWSRNGKRVAGCNAACVQKVEIASGSRLPGLASELLYPSAE